MLIWTSFSLLQYDGLLLLTIINCFNTILPKSVFSFRDPFAAHRQQMRLMFGPFGMDPFALTPQIQAPRAPRRQVTLGRVDGAVSVCFVYFMFMISTLVNLF